MSLISYEFNEFKEFNEFNRFNGFNGFNELVLAPFLKAFALTGRDYSNV
jgi:hypothetical protein